MTVLKSVGMRLSVEPENQVHAWSWVGDWLNSRAKAVIQLADLF